MAQPVSSLSVIDLGGIRALGLYDCEYQYPLEGIFPDHAEEALARYGDEYPANFFGSFWPIRVFGFVIVDNARIIVVDPGVGQKGPVAERLGVSGAFAENLRAASIRPESVTDVVVSHWHGDHLGGTLTAGGKPVFPQAVHHIHAADWMALTDQATSGSNRAREARHLLTLANRVDLRPFSDPFQLTGGVSLWPMPGHTPGTTMLSVQAARGELMLDGDAIHHPVQLSEPGWIDGYDHDPVAALAVRAKLTSRLVGGGLLGASHFAEPFGRVVRSGSGVRWVPVQAT